MDTERVHPNIAHVIFLPAGKRFAHQPSVRPKTDPSPCLSWAGTSEHRQPPPAGGGGGEALKGRPEEPWPRASGWSARATRRRGSWRTSCSGCRPRGPLLGGSGVRSLCREWVDGGMDRPPALQLVSIHLMGMSMFGTSHQNTTVCTMFVQYGSVNIANEVSLLTPAPPSYVSPTGPQSRPRDISWETKSLFLKYCGWPLAAGADGTAGEESLRHSLPSPQGPSLTRRTLVPPRPLRANTPMTFGYLPPPGIGISGRPAVLRWALGGVGQGARGFQTPPSSMWRGVPPTGLPAHPCPPISVFALRDTRVPALLASTLAIVCVRLNFHDGPNSIPPGGPGRTEGMPPKGRVCSGEALQCHQIAGKYVYI